MVKTARRNCHWQEQRPYILVIKGKEGKEGSRRGVNTIMVARGVEFCMT